MSQPRLLKLIDHNPGGTRSAYSYPGIMVRNIHGQNRVVRISRAVAWLFLGPPPSPEQSDVDHIDHDPWNNNTENLRWVTKAQNSLNRRGNRNRRGRYATGFKNVYRSKGSDSYTIGIGGFDTPDRAAKAADLVANVAFKEFASPNFPQLSVEELINDLVAA
jgi:hypothetical protein